MSVRDRPGFTVGCGGCETLANEQLWQSGMAALVLESVIDAHLGEHLGTVPRFQSLDDVRQSHAFVHTEHCATCLAVGPRRRYNARPWNGVM